MNKQDTDLSRAETVPAQLAVKAPKRGDEEDTIPPIAALEADLIALQAELLTTLSITGIQWMEKEGDGTVVFRAVSTGKDLTHEILHRYRGITIHGKNTFIFGVPRGGRTQKVKLIVVAG